MGSGTKSTRSPKRRIQLLVLVVLGGFAVLALRATWLSTVAASTLSAKADRQHMIRVDLPAERGAIMSADGRTLAVDRPTMLVSADARYVKDPAAVAETITSVTHGDAAERARIEQRLRTKGAYVILAKQVSFRQADYLKTLNIDGLHFERTSKRSYPLGKTAGQVLGLTDLDSGAGIEGLERSLNDALAGRAGKRVEIRDPRLQQTVRLVEAKNPRPGEDVKLTINADIQQKMEAVLASTRRAYKAKGAMGVIMDPNTGAILAMSSVPRVDPNNRAALNPDDVRSRSVTDPYEPGSVFKVVTVAGALEEGLTTPTRRWLVPPSITINPGTKDQFTLHDSHKRDSTEVMTTTQILQRSSNIGTIEISKLLAKRRHLRLWMSKFGFGQPTGIDMAGEAAGSLLPVAKWSSGSRINIPLGQGVAATQVQLIRAYAAIANGGYLVTPHIVASVGGQAAPVKPRVQVISPAVSRKLTRILETVVEGSDGTGVEASLPGYNVAGKTGTAQTVDPKTGKYVDRYRSSFIGYVPSRKPRLLIAVMVDDPSPAGPHTGGEVAAPAFREIADYALSTLGIPHA
jgi:cell division protein FtsI (penicillin-binding protein 3)